MTDTVTDTADDLSVIEFSIGCSRTLNLGNFNSLKIEASVTVEVREDSNMADLKAAAQKELRALLEETYKAQHRIKTQNGEYPT